MANPWDKDIVQGGNPWDKDIVQGGPGRGGGRGGQTAPTSTSGVTPLNNPLQWSAEHPGYHVATGGIVIPDNNFVTQGASDIKQGAQRMISPITHPEQFPPEKSKIMPIVGGAGRMLGGAGKIASPILAGAGLPGLIAAPAATLLGMATGAESQFGGQRIAESMGATPEDAEGVGNLAGLAAGIPGAIGGHFVDQHVLSPTGKYNPLKVAPSLAATRVLRPVPSDFNFPGEIAPNSDFGFKEQSGKIPATISLIKATNPGFRPSVNKETAELNFIPAANKTIAILQDQLQPWIDRMQGSKISGQPVIDATHEGINSLLPSEQETARKSFMPTGKSLLARAYQDYGDGFTPQQARDRLKLLNERLSPFYNKNQAGQSAALADIPEAVLKRQRDALADALYRHLDPENEGAGPRQIQSRTGDVIHLRDAAARRENAIAAEQPLTALGEFLDPIKQLIPNPFKTKGPGLAYSQGAEGKSIPLLRRAFNAVDETPGINELGSIPRPIILGDATQKRLGSGPIIGGPVADQSGPIYNERNNPMARVPIALNPANFEAVPGRLTVLPNGPAGSPRPAAPIGSSGLVSPTIRPVTVYRPGTSGPSNPKPIELPLDIADRRSKGGKFTDSDIQRIFGGTVK